VLDGHVLLQVPEAAVAAVDPDRRVGAAHQVAAAGGAAGTPVRPRAPQHGQFHVQPHCQGSTAATSGPRNRTPTVRNVSTRPDVKKTCCGSGAGSVAIMFSLVRRSRTANAVSSALDTRTTPLPITSPMVRANSG